jgi:hypothetical protein
MIKQPYLAIFLKETIKITKEQARKYQDINLNAKNFAASL